MAKKLTWSTVKVKLGDLKEWDKNPVKISEHDARELAKSIDRFEHVLPYVAAAPLNGKKELPLLDGHQRKRVELTLRNVSAETVVDVRVPSRKLTESERAEIAVRLRKNTGEFDDKKLLEWFEADDLMDWGFGKDELEQIGFEFEEARDTPAEIDRAAELLEKWGVKTGDLWQIGEHRLICGDCTDAATVARVMEGEKADMVFTDPPYNVASESRNYAADKSKAMKDLSEAEWDNDFDISALFPVLDQLMAEDCAVYICTSHWLVQKIWEWMWKWSDFCFYCVWCKPNPMPSLSKRHWTWATELIPYAVRGKHVSNFPQDGHALNWWAIPKAKDTDHPTEKVLEVPARAISFSSNPGAVVFDGFSGSGTTLVACENLSRRCRAIEISPAYVAVTLERFYQHTGIMPKLVRK